MNEKLQLNKILKKLSALAINQKYDEFFKFG